MLIASTNPSDNSYTAFGILKVLIGPKNPQAFLRIIIDALIVLTGYISSLRCEIIIIVLIEPTDLYLLSVLIELTKCSSHLQIGFAVAHYLHSVIAYLLGTSCKNNKSIKKIFIGCSALHLTESSTTY